MNDDHRFYPWPRLRKKKYGYLIKGRFLTPLRVELFNECIRFPLQRLWRLLTALLLVDLFLGYLGWPRIADYFSIDTSVLFYLLASFCLLHFEELISRMWITTLFLGKRIKIRVTEDEVIFSTPFGKKIFKRSEHIVFTAVPIPQSVASGYIDSKFIEAVVDNSTTVRLFECYDPRKAGKLVVNANYAINRSDHSSEEEFDPRERKTNSLATILL